MEKNFGLEEILTWCKVGNNVALYIATHPDDSCFSAGTLYLLRKANVTVKVCLVTLGGAGWENYPQEVQSRKEEFEEECRKTGANGIYLFDYLKRVYSKETTKSASMVDGKVKDNPLMRDAFIRLLRDEKPSVGFIPSINEKHYDHQEVRKCIEKALWRSGRPSKLGLGEGQLGEPERHFPSEMKVYEYETVTMSLGQGALTYVDITGEAWKIKSRAFGAHKSQIVRDAIAYVVAPKAISEARGRELYLPRELKELIKPKLTGSLKDILDSDICPEKLQGLNSDDFMKAVMNWASEESPKAEAFKTL